jgi:hypothetical protein
MPQLAVLALLLLLLLVLRLLLLLVSLLLLLLALLLLLLLRVRLLPSPWLGAGTHACGVASPPSGAQGNSIAPGRNPHT